MSPIDFDIIDFHTHPFLTEESNICSHIPYCKMGVEETLQTMNALRISYFCGSVIRNIPAKTPEDVLANMRSNNADALKMQEIYKGRYIPGFHVQPAFLKESCEEVEKMGKLGIKLVGEIVPYKDGWTTYYSKELLEIFKLAEEYDMVVSLHTAWDDDMDKLVEACPHLIIVGAHPAEGEQYRRHIERAKRFDNYYIDLSGTAGYGRHGAIRHLVDEMGLERVLFGSDFPTCSPAMAVGGVLLNDTLTDSEKEAIFSLNAKKLLKL